MASAQSLLVSSVLGLALLGFAPSADAECAMARTFVSPPSGSFVHPNPTFYVFHPAHLGELDQPLAHAPAPLPPRDQMRDFGRDFARVQMDVVSRNAAYVTYKVQVDTHGSTEIDLSWTSQHGSMETYRYSISSDIDVSGRRFVPPARASHKKSQWTCSRTNERRIEMQPSTAIAFAVDRASSTEELNSAEAKRSIHPPDMRAFWGSLRESAEARPPTLSLGYHNCLGATALEGDVEDTFYVRIKPLYSYPVPRRVREEPLPVYGVSRTDVWLVEEPEASEALSQDRENLRCGFSMLNVPKPTPLRITRIFAIAGFAGMLMGLAFAMARIGRKRRRWVFWIGALGIANAAMLATLAGLAGTWLLYGASALGCALLGGLAFGTWARRD